MPVQINKSQESIAFITSQKLMIEETHENDRIFAATDKMQ